MTDSSQPPEEATHCVQIVLYLKSDDENIQDVLELLYQKISEVDAVLQAGIN